MWKPNLQGSEREVNLRSELVERVGKPISNLVNNIKKWELHKKAYGKGKEHAKAAKEAAKNIAYGTKEFAVGVKNSVAKRNWSSLRETLHSHDLDSFIWISLAYFLMDWFVFNFQQNVPLKIMLNLVFVVLVLKVYLKRGLAVTFLDTLFLVAIIGGIGELSFFGMSQLSAVVSSVGVFFVLWLLARNFFKESTEGMVGVALVFLLQSGFLETLAVKFPLIFQNEFGGFLLTGQAWPYWLLLALYYGHQSEGGPSKLNSMFSTILIGWWIFLLINMQFAFGFFGDFQQGFSEEDRAEINEQFEERYEKQSYLWKRSFAPLICYWKTLTWSDFKSHQECMDRLSAPPNGTGVDDGIIATPKKIDSRFDLTINGVGSTGRIIPTGSAVQKIYQQSDEAPRVIFLITGDSNVERIALVECLIDGDKATVLIDGDEKNNFNIPKKDRTWRQEIVCDGPGLKKGVHEFVLRIKASQITTTDYSVFLLDQCEYDKIIRIYETPQFTKAWNSLKDKADQKKLKKKLYEKIPVFKKIKTAGFEPRPDPETASFLLETTRDLPIIPIEGDNGEFSFQFSIKNNDNGKIAKVNDVTISIPNYLVKSDRCKILTKKPASDLSEKEKSQKDRVDFYQIELTKSSFFNPSKLEAIKAKKQQSLGVTCKFFINNARNYFLDVMTLNQIDVKAKMDYEYIFEKKIKVSVN